MQLAIELLDTLKIAKYQKEIFAKKLEGWKVDFDEKESGTSNANFFTKTITLNVEQIRKVGAAPIFLHEALHVLYSDLVFLQKIFDNAVSKCKGVNAYLISEVLNAVEDYRIYLLARKTNDKLIKENLEKIKKVYEGEEMEADLLYALVKGEKSKLKRYFIIKEAHNMDKFYFYFNNAVMAYAKSEAEREQ